ncbi:MAG TPA: tetratricopeptide repeat protein [Terriglobales bacterium]|nr:tetratricopeptide repeat protein [Terriglobales bacterium]
MALGLTFNKAKVLAAAEKYVQQGKLQSAIAEYEKISKQDAKDLTVLNTIGDLYFRLGHNDRAADYFRKVGDAYAADGFVVKAIAMYKKLTKLGSVSTDALVKLADLYTQQGLYNDARAQYMAIADQYLKNNDRENAIGIFKKMLDLDPDNAAMQAKVADLYQKLGRNQEALEIYFNSAQSLHQKGSTDAARQALDHVLKIDPKHAQALVLRGQLAAESGHTDVAIRDLAKLPDLDSRPDALRSLLQAYVQTGEFAKAEPVLNKLVTVHKDSAAIATYAESLLHAGNFEKALGVYEQYADKFLAENKQGFLDTLAASVSKVKESESGLQSLMVLLRKADAPAHAIREVQELLAHAYVQNGLLQQASELYLELSKAEPENPLHEQNYNQVISRMGKDSITRELSNEEAGQALMVDELESAPGIVQEYSLDVAEEITSALTDSELFSSYNVPEKAVVPLERVLSKAPNDVRVRQRLASLYARLGRFADAAQCCGILAEVHKVAGNAEKAEQLRDLATKYQEQAAGAAPSAPPPEAASVLEAATVIGEVAIEAIPFQASSVADDKVTAAEEAAVAEFDVSSPVAGPPAEMEVANQPSAAPAETEHAEEWEEMLTVESPTAEPAAKATIQEVTAQDAPDEIADEARFYVAQGMLSEAQSAITRLEAAASSHPALAELRAAVQEIEEKKRKEASAKPAAVPHKREEKPAPVPKPKTEPPVLVPIGDDSDILGDLDQPQDGLEDLIPEVAAGEPATFTAPSIGARPHAPVVAAPAMSSALRPAGTENPLAGMLSDLEDALGDLSSPTPVPVAKPKVGSQPAARSATPVAAAPAATATPDDAKSMLSDLLEEFKEEVEEPVAEADDPETHYNLGVAFREMGLLDEAIGELQKVCRLLDSGAAFSQPIQAYTWLAQCLVDKGAPQAAIRWYERALNVKGINEDSRMAVYYDMANAFESAGNKKAALDNFMQVYGSNIDYRDVADRIRSLSK